MIHEVETGQPEFHDSVKDRYRQIYYVALDLIITCITDRFEQVDYRMYANCEQLLLKAANNEDYSDEIENVTSFYGSNFQPASLQAQLVNFTSNYPREDGVKASLKDLIDYFKNLSASHRALIPQVEVLLRLILVMPATNASSERVFSALRRLKSYLRSTMCQTRLNHLMLLNVHREKTDGLKDKMLEVANTFVEFSEHRKKIFGVFTSQDLAKASVMCKHKATQAM